MTTLLNLEFANHNAVRAYPLAHTASGISVGETMRLPNDFLVAAAISVPASRGLATAGFHLNRVAAFGDSVLVEIGYASEGGSQVVGAAVVPIEDAVEAREYGLAMRPAFASLYGVIGVWNHAAMRSIGGSHAFSHEAGRLDADAIRTTPACVTGISVSSGGVRSKTFRGDVRLTAGRNARIRTSVDGSTGVTTIRFDAIDGAGTLEDCVCPGGAAIGPPIRTINERPPDSQGDFTFQGGPCLTVQTTTAGLIFRNTCAEPCCGCEELQTLTDAAIALRNEVASVNAFAQSLAGSVEIMQTVVLGSRLGDDSCRVGGG